MNELSGRKHVLKLHSNSLNDHFHEAGCFSSLSLHAIITQIFLMIVDINLTGGEYILH